MKYEAKPSWEHLVINYFKSVRCVLCVPVSVPMVVCVYSVSYLRHYSECPVVLCCHGALKRINY